MATTTTTAGGDPNAVVWNGLTMRELVVERKKLIASITSVTQKLKGESHANLLKRHAAATNMNAAVFKTTMKNLLAIKAAIKQKRRDIIDFATYDHSLETLNKWLVALERKEAPTKTQAHAALAKIHINIYDLKDGNYGMVHKSFYAMRSYTIEHEMFFPLKKAKRSNAKVFLRVIFNKPRKAAPGQAAPRQAA